MAIHLVQRSRAFKACIANCAPDDVIVLTGEGVVAALSKNERGLKDDAILCYASSTDVHERALVGRLKDSIRLITDEELVELCAIHSPVVSWNQP